MSDLIKREDSIDAVIEWYGCKPNDIEAFEKIIEAIPSADRPQGEWIDEGRNLWGCSNCGMEIYSESERDRNEFHKWCSRCGAQMKGSDDE